MGQSTGAREAESVLDAAVAVAGKATAGTSSSTTPCKGAEGAAGGSWGLSGVVHEECASVGNKGRVLVSAALVIIIFVAMPGICVIAGGLRSRGGADNDGRGWGSRWRWYNIFGLCRCLVWLLLAVG